MITTPILWCLQVVGEKIRYSNDKSSVGLYLCLISHLRVTIVNLFGDGMDSRAQTLFQTEF